MTNNVIVKPGIYQHYKGNQYKVIGIAKHSETLQDMVVYEALYDNKLSKIWVRPLSMFFDKVEKDGVLVERFKFIK